MKSLVDTMNGSLVTETISVARESDKTAELGTWNGFKLLNWGDSCLYCLG
jgi:hypothetical protein